jgi:hypothetical protein
MVCTGGELVAQESVTGELETPSSGSGNRTVRSAHLSGVFQSVRIDITFDPVGTGDRIAPRARELR